MFINCAKKVGTGNIDCDYRLVIFEDQLIANAHEIIPNYWHFTRTGLGPNMLPRSLANADRTREPRSDRIPERGGQY